MSEKQKIATMLWFDNDAEEAARFYVSILPDSSIKNITKYTKSAEQASGKPAGSVMTVEFTLAGREFVALNGGPQFKFNESVSFVVNCDTQQELDEMWSKLSQGGDPNAQACGWLKDRFGLSWQVVPSSLSRLMKSGNTERVMGALMKMKKIDIGELERAAA
jgi:predicted 3-demethylubiquinone-9 3-methyltransferase (glyoxalase superfamily)